MSPTHAPFQPVRCESGESALVESCPVPPGIIPRTPGIPFVKATSLLMTSLDMTSLVIKPELSQNPN